MINNFKSIKWLYHELEEFREKIGQLEQKRKTSHCENFNNQVDHLSLAKKRILNLENYNHNIEN